MSLKVSAANGSVICREAERETRADELLIFSPPLLPIEASHFGGRLEFRILGALALVFRDCRGRPRVKWRKRQLETAERKESWRRCRNKNVEFGFRAENLEVVSEMVTVIAPHDCPMTDD